MSHPRVVLTAEDESFDRSTTQQWQDEGFQVSYLPFTGSRKQYERELQHLPDPLELGEKYAIVAYGEAASVVLDLAQKPMPKLCALVAYYPDTLTNPANGFPPSLNVCVHLAASQGMAPRYKSFVYPFAEPGFAEADLDEYDTVSADLAWTRTLAVVRRGFEIIVDLEDIREEHVAGETADEMMSAMVPEPYVNHVPTLTGGIGYKDLHRFYRDYFIPGHPPSFKMRLISRTIGTDRVVDEMFVSFRHTQEVPWMLPGVQPTGKEVEVALVAIVCIRGGKLYHEHVYWDQAAVLAQIGLIDSKLVPGGKVAERLPVVGKEGARKALDPNSSKSNQLIPGW